MVPPKLRLGAIRAITRSVRFAREIVTLADPHDDGSGAAITIVGDDIVVDFGGATLRGSSPDTLPDQRKGTGILVSGRNIVVRNLSIRGYRNGIVARGCPGLVLEGIDASHQWKQHLASTPEREDLSDWMSFHQNDHDEWLGHGAAFHLIDCDEFRVRDCRATGGQSGLFLTRSDRGEVVACDFSFLSALGIALYRSSRNRILHNKIDWCVRGYSHGVYNRGQDSAGILVYEQSSSNLFAYNSVTHGGDGFFLWAGQSTMDTGRGGCDDNVLYANDFSHAPTNGIEATFSRNAFVHNLVLECWHGIWGGYSHGTAIVGNVFGGNAEAIAIEHGRDIRIEANRFLADRTAVNLWRNERQDPNWAYVRKHDTSSRDYRIEGNTFAGCGKTIAVRATDGVVERGNRVLSPTSDRPVTMEGSGLVVPATEIDPVAYAKRFETGWNPADPPEAAAPWRVEPLPGVRSAFLPRGAVRGRRAILVDEWGPYDFRRPLLVDRGRGRHEVLGPKGRWRVVSAEGATLSVRSGTVPGTVDIAVPAGSVGRVNIDLEYVGAETIDVLGRSTPAGRPVRFGLSRFHAPIDWTVAFHAWSVPKDPADVHSEPDPVHFAKVAEGAPLATLRTDRLDFAGRFAPGVPGDHFLTMAEGVFTVPPGRYRLEATTDDGLRGWLDGKPIFAGAWKYQGPTAYVEDIVLGGTHRLRIEHFQIDGYAALRVRLRPSAAQ